MSRALLSEFLDAAERVTPGVEQAMRGAGGAFMVDRLPRYGVARIEPHGAHYEPCDDGVPAVIVTDLFGGLDIGVAVEDLVAYLPSRPGTMFRRTGAIDALGQDAIFEAQCDGAELAVYRTPLGWLAANRRGACLVNWAADPRTVFHGVAALRCEDDALARRMQARIAECSLPVPRVVTMHQTRRRAA
jgi:hypothetical protein